MVILLHGFPEFWYGWKEQIPYLVRQGYRVVAPDQRGYNLSDKPTYIFMHHPPMALHLPKQDEIKLTDDTAFLDLINERNAVKHLFIGHVHRPTCGTIKGIPFATLGSISFQAPAPEPAWDWDSFIAAQEAPHYGVIYIEEGDVTLQYTQFCAYDVGMES